MEIFYSIQNEFSAFSLEHSLVLLGYVMLAATTYFFANRFLLLKGQRILGMLLALIPMFGVLLRMYVEYCMGEFSYLEDLPLFVCRLVSFALPILIWNKSQALFGVLYFWIMAGTINALITPDIIFGLPHFESIFYWIIHAGLVMAILYCVFVFKWKPTKMDIWRSFWWANLYLGLIHAINTLLDTNYSYTMYKPVKGSILDFFGPWPWYLLTGQLLALALFALFYLPFYFKQKVSPI